MSTIPLEIDNLMKILDSSCFFGTTNIDILNNNVPYYFCIGTKSHPDKIVKSLSYSGLEFINDDYYIGYYKGYKVIIYRYNSKKSLKEPSFYNKNSKYRLVSLLNYLYIKYSYKKQYAQDISTEEYLLSPTGEKIFNSYVKYSLFRILAHHEAEKIISENLNFFLWLFDIENIKDYNQQNNYHDYTLDIHSLKTMINLDKRASDVTKLAAFLHDIGKPYVQAPSKKHPGMSYKNHAKESILHLQRLKNLLYPEEFTFFCKLIKYHDANLELCGNNRSEILHHWARKMGSWKNFRDLLYLQLSDVQSHKVPGNEPVKILNRIDTMNYFLNYCPVGKYISSDNILVKERDLIKYLKVDYEKAQELLKILEENLNNKTLINNKEVELKFLKEGFL